MVKHERILLAVLGSTTVLTAVALVIVVLAAGGLAFRQAAVPGQAERTFQAAGRRASPRSWPGWPALR